MNQTYEKDKNYVAEQAGLGLTWSKNLNTVFLTTSPFSYKLEKNIKKRKESASHICPCNGYKYEYGNLFCTEQV